MSLFDKIDNAPPADFNSLLRKKPKKRFLVSDSEPVKTDPPRVDAPSPSASQSTTSNSDLGITNLSHDKTVTPFESTKIDDSSSPSITELSHDKSVTHDSLSIYSSPTDIVTPTTQDKTVSVTKLSHDKSVTDTGVTKSSQDNIVTHKSAITWPNDETVTPLSNFASDDAFFENNSGSQFHGQRSSKINLDEISADSASLMDANSSSGPPSPALPLKFDKNESPVTILTQDEIVSLTKSSHDENVTQELKTRKLEKEISITVSSHDNSVSVMELSQDKIVTSDEQRTSKQIEKGVTISSYDDNVMHLASEIDRPSKVIIKSHFTKCPNNFSFNLRKLSKAARILYRYLFRISYGWNQNTTSFPVSFGHLDKKLGFSRLTLFQNFKELEELKLIEKEIYQSNRGYIFKVRYYESDGKLTDGPIQKNFFCLDNNFFEIHETLKKSEQDVYLYLYEQSYGKNCNITNRFISTTGEIAATIDLSARRTLDALRGLCEKNLLKRLDRNSDLHYRYRVFLPHEVLKTELVPNLEVADSSTVTVLSQDNSVSITNSSQDNLSKSLTLSSQDENVMREIGVSFQEHVGITKTSQDESVNKERNKIIKTSSGVDDEILNFISEQTKQHPQFSFPISRKKILELLGRHQAEHLKTTFSKLLASLMREGVENPVGMYLHAVEDPTSYAVLQKPSTQELADKKRFENQIELREKSFADEVKRIIDSKQESFWNELDERIREEAVAKRRAEMGQGGELKIPDVAIKRSAIERTFWEQHHQAWESLPESERTARAGMVKQSIIKRVYAGEGKALPEPLPEREFLKSVDEYAEKLAMISVGKGSNT